MRTAVWRMFASVACLCVATAGIAIVAESPVSATPMHKASDILGAQWTKIFVTPSPQNPFGTGDPSTACWNIDGTLAPSGPQAVASCTTGAGTPLFIAGTSWECSTFPGDHPDYGTTEAELRACARHNDLQTPPSITFDGRPLTVAAVETSLLQITLPADNFLGLPAGSTGQSVAHAWVAQVNPPPPGTHTVVVDAGTFSYTTTFIIRSS